LNLWRLLDTVCDAALALAYPRACSACGVAQVEQRADAPACAACWAATRLFGAGQVLCAKCGAPAPGTAATGRGASAPVASVAVAPVAVTAGPGDEAVPGDETEAAPGTGATVRCRRCEAEAFTAARACGPYAGALRAAVLALKHEPFVGRRLALLLEETQARPPLDAVTLVVPAPLHPERERERGFNQAALLAAALAKRTGLALDGHSLVRVAHAGRHRAGMDARARRETVEGAFEVVRPRLVAGERVLLVDDVLTTGATASACAAALRAAGASEVFVLTVARA